ncbi:MAG: hypothetical protein OXI30_07355 [Chloroflexota bacterium]|nr:hypothetical protein [Chloroflexota bacterium]
MKNRSVIAIIGIALALICLVLPISIQAQTNSSVTISNLTYEGENIGGYLMILSWDAIPNETGAKIQVKGGGIADTWMSLDTNNSYTQDGKTYLEFENMATYRAQDIAFKFRVRVTLSDGSSTPWAYVDEDYS